MLNLKWKIIIKRHEGAEKNKNGVIKGKETVENEIKAAKSVGGFHWVERRRDERWKIRAWAKRKFILHVLQELNIVVFVDSMFQPKIKLIRQELLGL